MEIRQIDAHLIEDQVLIGLKARGEDPRRLDTAPRCSRQPRLVVLGWAHQPRQQALHCSGGRAVRTTPCRQGGYQQHDGDTCESSPHPPLLPTAKTPFPIVRTPVDAICSASREEHAHGGEEEQHCEATLQNDGRGYLHQMSPKAGADDRPD